MRHAFAVIALAIALPAFAADTIKVVIIDGQNNHDWKKTTPVLKKHLEDAGLFAVDVATTPEKGKPELAKFSTDLTRYDVLVSNYNGESWPKEFNDLLDGRLKEGK